MTRAGIRSPDVRRITTSVAVSALGTWSYNVGIAVYAYQQTHSTAWVAAATVGRYVPALALTGFGGRLADRYRRRTVAVACDLICAATMVALTVLAAFHGPLVIAIGLAALSSGVARIQSSAALSLAADLVVESQLVRSSVQISTSDAVATAIGPAIASAVLAVFAPAVLFALNGATFAVSAAFLARVRALPTRVSVAAPHTSNPDGAASYGSGYTPTVRVLWPLLATRTVAAFVYGVDVVVLAVIATQQLKQGTAGYGWLLAAAGAGGLVAAAVLRRADPVRRCALVSSTGLVLYALPLLFFVLEPALLGSLAAQLVRGFGYLLVTSTVIAALQRAVPSAVSGRVFGLAHALVLAGTSLGALITPFLLHALGLRSTLVVVSVVPLVAQLAVLPALVRFDRNGARSLASLEPRVDVLRQLSIFHDASRSTLYDVADRVSEVGAGPGSVVVREGDPADALFVLVSGEVEVTSAGDAGPAVLRRMTAPAYFGEIGVIHGVPRTATVTSTADSSLWRVPADAFLSAAAQAGLSGALAESMRVRFVAPGGSGAVPATEL